MRKVLNSRIFKIIYTVFIILFSMVMVLYLIYICLEGKDLFGYRLYTMPDNSMKGSYNKNDVLLVDDNNDIILETGNDIVYYGSAGGLEGRLIIHRILRVDNTKKNNITFVTQGITSSLPDPPISRKDILGKVLGKISLLTELNHIIKSQLGFLLVVFLPLVLILTIEIMRTVVSLSLEKNNPILEDRGKDEKKNKK